MSRNLGVTYTCTLYIHIHFLAPSKHTYAYENCMGHAKQTRKKAESYFRLVDPHQRHVCLVALARPGLGKPEQLWYVLTSHLFSTASRSLLEEVSSFCSCLRRVSDSWLCSCAVLVALSSSTDSCSTLVRASLNSLSSSRIVSCMRLFSLWSSKTYYKMNFVVWGKWHFTDTTILQCIVHWLPPVPEWPVFQPAIHHTQSAVDAHTNEHSSVPD